VWTGLIWFRIETSGGLLWRRYWTFGFQKILGSSWVCAKLAASQEELRSMKALPYWFSCKRCAVSREMRHEMWLRKDTKGDYRDIRKRWLSPKNTSRDSYRYSADKEDINAVEQATGPNLHIWWHWCSYKDHLTNNFLSTREKFKRLKKKTRHFLKWLRSIHISSRKCNSTGIKRDTSCRDDLSLWNCRYGWDVGAQLLQSNSFKWDRTSSCWFDYKLHKRHLNGSYEMCRCIRKCLSAIIETNY
jgi:hypothetical protein